MTVLVLGKEPERYAEMRPPKKEKEVRPDWSINILPDVSPGIEPLARDYYVRRGRRP